MIHVQVIQMIKMKVKYGSKVDSSLLLEAVPMPIMHGRV